MALVQLSVSTQSIRAAQQSSLVILAIAFGGLMLAGSLVVPLLVGRALRPLHRVTEASAAIAAGDMSQRVVAPPTSRSTRSTPSVSRDRRRRRLKLVGSHPPVHAPAAIRYPTPRTVWISWRLSSPNF